MACYIDCDEAYPYLLPFLGKRLEDLQGDPELYELLISGRFRLSCIAVFARNLTRGQIVASYNEDLAPRLTADKKHYVKEVLILLNLLNPMNLQSLLTLLSSITLHS
jgi:hypothetical protein